MLTRLSQMKRAAGDIAETSRDRVRQLSTDAADSDPGRAARGHPARHTTRRRGRVSKTTLYDWIAAGTIPASRHRGMVFFDPAMIAACMLLTLKGV